MDNKYHAISCHFYDELEFLAVKKIIAKITYFENENEMTIEDLIVDFKTKNKEEFLILKNGTQIRLDKIIKINDLVYKTNC
ncbi:MAG: transcriptional antiterminator Rof [Aliarcobacter sp.]|nr:transcriptional antiterminator Rof [Aliarcobacter sp.]